MLEKIRLVWRYRSRIIPLIRRAERLTAAVAAASTTNVGALRDVEEALYRTILDLTAVVDHDTANKLLIDIHNINEWDKPGQSGH